MPGEDVGLAADAGMVQVLYGTSGGLSAAGSQSWHQNSVGFADNAEAGDEFGGALAVGDLNGDGFADLVDRRARRGRRRGGRRRRRCRCMFGSASGLTSAGSQPWSQYSPGIAGNPETGDRFGSVLATGRLDGDGYADLVIGVPAEDVNHVADAGIVQVIRGAAGGLTATGSQRFSEYTSGVAGNVEAGDGFGERARRGEHGRHGRPGRRDRRTRERISAPPAMPASSHLLRGGAAAR